MTKPNTVSTMSEPSESIRLAELTELTRPSEPIKPKEATERKNSANKSGAWKAAKPGKVVDGRFLMGLGIGILLACLLLRPYLGKEPSATEIEARARSMGMVYEDEIRAISDKEGNKDNKSNETNETNKSREGNEDNKANEGNEKGEGNE